VIGKIHIENLDIFLYIYLYMGWEARIMASRKQANFLLSEEVVEELRRTVEKREQSRFVENALQKELKRLRLEKALKLSFGAWKDEDHPEMAQGTENFVRVLRKTTRGQRPR
jgi:hypothetical protein